jgi:curved DNA-binding protein CbpA
VRKFYTILDLSEDASPEQIERAYKRAASRTHPDKNRGREEEAVKEFQIVKEAYECLSDPERRARYDETGDSSVEDGNPVDDLFVYIFNELLDHFDSMKEVLLNGQIALEQMLEEVRTKKKELTKRIASLKKMQGHVKYKGKGSNVLQGMVEDKIKSLEAQLVQFESAEIAGVAVHTMLSEYEATDKPAPRDKKQRQAEEADRLFSELMGMSERMSRGRGGFRSPFGP